MFDENADAWKAKVEKKKIKDKEKEILQEFLQEKKRKEMEKQFDANKEEWVAQLANQKVYLLIYNYYIHFIKNRN